MEHHSTAGLIVIALVMLPITALFTALVQEILSGWFNHTVAPWALKQSAVVYESLRRLTQLLKNTFTVMAPLVICAALLWLIQGEINLYESEAQLQCLFWLVAYLMFKSDIPEYTEQYA